MNKKAEEMEYSKFFINYLNCQFDLDYIVRPNQDEDRNDPDIDVYAISKKHPTLNLQVRTRERIFKELLPRLQKKQLL